MYQKLAIFPHSADKLTLLKINFLKKKRIKQKKESRMLPFGAAEGGHIGICYTIYPLNCYSPCNYFRIKYISVGLGQGGGRRPALIP